jgi:hypothetical protein
LEVSVPVADPCVQPFFFSDVWEGAAALAGATTSTGDVDRERRVEERAATAMLRWSSEGERGKEGLWRQGRRWETEGSLGRRRR